MFMNLLKNYSSKSENEKKKFNKRKETDDYDLTLNDLRIFV